MTSCRVQPGNRLRDFAVFHFFRFQRRSQEPGTLAARVVALSLPFARRLATVGYLVITAPMGLRFLPRVREGMSLLAVLERVA